MSARSLVGRAISRMFSARTKRRHAHDCTCGKTWTHGDAAFRNRRAHTCPKCRRVVWRGFYRRG